MTVTWPLPPLWVSKVQPCFAKKRRSSAAFIDTTYLLYNSLVNLSNLPRHSIDQLFAPLALARSVIWDNRQTMHRARRFDDRNEIRDVRRTTLAGDVATIEQVA
jgi:alpha-ketoglutarate-dependent taurine dioxygenase